MTLLGGHNVEPLATVSGHTELGHLPLPWSAGAPLPVSSQQVPGWRRFPVQVQKRLHLFPCFPKCSLWTSRTAAQTAGPESASGHGPSDSDAQWRLRALLSTIPPGCEAPPRGRPQPPAHHQGNAPRNRPQMFTRQRKREELGDIVGTRFCDQ